MLYVCPYPSPSLGGVDTQILGKAYVLDKEAEALRWFYFPSESTPTVSAFPSGDKRAAACIISPKIYRQGELDEEKNKVSAVRPAVRAHSVEFVLDWREGSSSGFHAVQNVNAHY